MAINKQFKHISLAIGVLVLGLIILVILKLTSAPVAVKPVIEKVWPVASQLIKVRNFRPRIKEFGTIVAGSQAELRPLVSGRIIEVGKNYYEGSIVKKGQMLIKIDPFEHEVKLEDSKAALSEVVTRVTEVEGEIKYETKLLAIIKSQLSIRKRDLERRRKLVNRGSASKKSLDDAEISYNDTAKNFALRQQVILRLKNRLNQHKATIRRATLVLKQANRNVQETIVIAPFDGFLANADVSVGQRISTNERLARLIEAERFEVKFRLSERDFSNLIKVKSNLAEEGLQSSELIGKEVDVKWIIGDRAFTYKAKIQRLGAEIDAAGGGVDVYAQLSNIDLTTPLRPGAFVEVLIPSKLYSNVVRVPDTAVVQGRIIYLIESGRVKETVVSVVRRGEDFVLIRGTGLDDKIIITRPFPKITNGLLVESK
jgi:RND family efflux transporter MFP subunit